MTKSFSIILLFLFSNCITDPGVIYLIPKGYVGRVIIFYGQPNGKDKIMRDNFRVFEIPPNGALRTKFDVGSKVMPVSNLKFYYVDNDKVQTEIPLETNNYEPSNKKEIKIYLIKDGNFDVNGQRIRFTEFIIDSYDHLDSYSNFNPTNMFNNSK